MKKIFIVTGEHSGDLHASFVVRELKKLVPDIIVEAVGGSNLEAEGVKLFSGHAKMSVVGTYAFRAIINHVQLGKNIANYLKNEYKPDLVLLIDYGGFNLRLASVLKKMGIPVFYYVSPQIWASRKGRLKKIKKYISKMMVILPFEEKIHREAGVNAEYVGHPLVSQLDFSINKDNFIKENNLDPNKKIVGIFPGSRIMEVNNMLEIFLKSASLVSQKIDNLQFCIGQATNISDEIIQNKLKMHSGIDVKVIKNQNHALISSSDVLMLASGTITMEATLYKTPMVVSYKAPQFAYLVYLLIRYIKFIALPNIISGRKLIQEYVQHNAKPELIAAETISLLSDEIKRRNMILELNNVNDMLGNKVSSFEVARIIKEYLDGRETI
jgi:lipid-A-disaccharide synthase